MSLPGDANRRQFLSSALAAPLAAGGAETIAVDPKPLFDISPYLYMQFMEPLGITDSSVEAAWDYDAGDWREDFLTVVRDPCPLAEYLSAAWRESENRDRGGL